MAKKLVSCLRLRIASRILLVLALLLLQQGALTHALSHPYEPAKPHGGPQCELCHAFAAVDDHVSPPSTAKLITPSDIHDSLEPTIAELREQRFVAFASRAPPRAL